MVICNVLHTVIWYILWPFGNVAVIWYIFPRFGILCQKNLATLDHTILLKINRNVAQPILCRNLCINYTAGKYNQTIWANFCNFQQSAR
jgi:hypothetical protein